MKGLLLAATLLFSTLAQAAVVEKVVEYTHGDTRLKGLLAWDDSQTTPRPGVLVVHEWWGLNDYAKSRARQLASEGYVALAVDMYGEGKVAEHPEEAQGFMQAAVANWQASEGRFRAAYSLLKAQPGVDGARIAAIGYCFGGMTVLEMARAGLPLRAVASFHGALGTDHPATPGTIKARILVANGAADPMVKPEQIAAFRDEMRKAGADLTFINYPGALHSFTNPGATEAGKRTGLPLAYDADADAHSWQAMLAMFTQAFAR